jgi:hypothetical protein
MLVTNPTPRRDSRGKDCRLSLEVKSLNKNIVGKKKTSYPVEYVHDFVPPLKRENTDLVYKKNLGGLVRGRRGYTKNSYRSRTHLFGLLLRDGGVSRNVVLDPAWLVLVGVVSVLDHARAHPTSAINSWYSSLSILTSLGRSWAWWTAPSTRSPCPWPGGVSGRVWRTCSRRSRCRRLRVPVRTSTRRCRGTELDTNTK